MKIINVDLELTMSCKKHLQQLPLPEQKAVNVDEFNKVWSKIFAFGHPLPKAKRKTTAPTPFVLVVTLE